MRRASLLMLLLAACADEPAPLAADASGPAQQAAQGGAGGERIMPPGHSTGGPGDPGELCAPSLSPDDEFYVPCEDAGAMPGTDAAVIDAGAKPDGSVEHPDAGAPSEPPLLGPCADRTPSCDVGRAETSLAMTRCAINGERITMEREICEVCGTATALVAFGVVTRPCGICAQVYRESPHTYGEPIAANECRSRSDTADLTGSASDPFCVDVYAYLGSGTMSASGTSVEVVDEVRVCRCDRTTDTCTPCIAGACDDAMP